MNKKPISIIVYKTAGNFAENKDVARKIRQDRIIPALEKSQEVILDFQKVESTTQSFIHALISALFRNYGDDVLDRITFKNCNETVKKLINIVIEYMQLSA
ncbi:hypothetical protein A3A49_01675 [Candidatus Curtissbacteria bacterium RIFCSPLOWO2_01_FULL_38_11b]|uniref:DUF4325 domain-containing protein n=1 Tax=Candidatus Curtissbacteria bacterium RIFCSPLOWO2_01_FULL_38_11b TaxID=1797725 RepID=A0A1F5H0C2_9BACT|nr:MAG: hypothetical protein A3A49_01675 [Candidatus Curtissbacteria bacterium RIFCSPLOWO2_01_FULL_38_11b]